MTGMGETLSDDEVHGALGVVRLRIGGGPVPGEVRVMVRGTYENFIAFAEEELVEGTHIVVYNSRGPRAVDVMPAPSWLRP